MITSDGGSRKTAVQAVRAVAWFGLGSYLTLAIALVRSIILARIIAPEAFGIVAFAAFLASVFGLIRSFGLNYALIHRPDPDRGTLSTYLALQIVLSVAALLAALAFAPLLGRFYSGSIVYVMLVLTAIAIVQGIAGLPTALLEKELQFARVTSINVVAAILKSVIPIWLALRGWGVWAIVMVEVVDALVRLIMTWALKPVYPGLRIERESLTFFWEYGRKVWSGSVAGAITYQLGNFLVGSFSSIRNLGFYSKAYEFGTYPTLLTSAIVSRVTLPTYAKLQDDRAGLSRAYELVLGGIMRGSAWLGLLLVVGIYELVLLFIGERWLPIVPIVQVLAVYVVLRPAVDDSAAILAATGRPGLLSRLTWYQAGVLLVAGPILTIAYGAIGTAAAVDIMILVGLGMFYLGAVREMVTISVYRVFVPPLAVAAVSAALTMLIARALDIDALWPRLIAETGAATLIYVALLLLWERKRMFEQIAYVRGVFRKSSGPEPSAEERYDSET